MQLPLTRAALATLLLALLALPALADEKAEGPEVEVVQPGRFVSLLKVDGVLAPRGAVEVSYEPEVYAGGLEIVSARGPGKVKKGEVLVRFDEEDAARHLRDAERALKVAKLKHARLEKDLGHRAAGRERKLAEIDERSRRAEQALQLFLEEFKPLRIAQAEYSLEGSQNRLQDQKEELEQLEKMYKADDLTEETEEIVLRRTRRNLARSERSLSFARRRHKTFLEITLPNEENDLRMRARERRAELASYRALIEIDQEVEKISLAKSQQDLVRQEKRFGDLRRDVDGLRLVAPADGLAVPGRFSEGKWLDVEGTLRLLAPGKKVKARQVLYTIVQPGNVRVRTTVGEKSILKIEAGQEAQVVPGVLPAQTLSATLASVLPAPEKGRYRVLVDLKETDARLMPGQTVKVKVAWYEKDDALSVPVAAVRTKDDVSHVWVVSPDGDEEPREVKLGEKGEGRLEILAGLEAGDVVLVKAPQEEKAK